MTEGKHTFGNFKKFCRSASIKDLEKELKEKELELFKANARQYKGNSRKMYTNEDKGKIVPIKILRKQVAIIKTYLNNKMLRNAK